MYRNVRHQGYRGCDCNCNRVHSFFIANHSFDDSYVGKQGESEKEKCTEVVKEFLLENINRCPCCKNVIKMLKTAFDAQAFSAFSALFKFSACQRAIPHLESVRKRDLL